MDNPFDTLVAPLVIAAVAAAISGLAFVAYKHPAGYRRLLQIMMPLPVAAIVFVAGTHVGTIFSGTASLQRDVTKYPEVPLRTEAESIHALHSATNGIVLLVLVSLGVVLYLWLLLNLPRILADEPVTSTEEQPTE